MDRRNNFDLLRLLAALQVVYVHGVHHLGIPFGPIGRTVNEAISLFPGVAIFFVISGFLISRSYERATGPMAYARNRFLRVYPGLWAAFAMSLVLLLVFGAIDEAFVTSPQFAAWVAAQLTVVQFFNPDALRGFGTGVLNGSLWTIPVELQFYAALPLLYFGCRALRARASAVLAVVAVVSYAIWFVAVDRDGSPGLAQKLLQVTLLPHLHLFLIGVLLQRHYQQVARVVEGKVMAWLAGYVGVSVAVRLLLGTSANGNPLFDGASAVAAAVSAVLLAFVVVSFAFSGRGASERLLRGNDVSYGVYVYHMLVVNAFVELAWTREPWTLAAMTAVTLLLALASWRFVERPSLRLKAGGAWLSAVFAGAGRLQTQTVPLRMH